jgi:4-amino-4-deoxy-L-arabinose transferase-like glycosyltransferase
MVMKKAILFVILIIAFLLRFVSVAKFPVGFNADEASFGYDAYSILHTGRDQWGNFMPLVFKSFGDFKSPVYGYLTVPFVAIFGLNIFAVRLPNVIIGTLALLAVYLLVSEIGKIGKLPESRMMGWLGIAAALLLAVNPWSVMMSRGAFEANLITFFLPMGIYFFLKGLTQNKYFIWSAVFLGVSMFTYHSAKLITPMVAVGLLIIFRKALLKIKLKKLILPAVIFLIFFGALLYTFEIGGGSRITERSITQGALDEGFQERMAAISGGMNSKVAKILHNKYEVIAARFVNNYLQYTSPKFLFESGAGDGSYGMIPGIGVIYILEGLLIVGIVPLILIKKEYRNLIIALFLWFLISPLPAALATGIGYSGNRAEGMLPILQIIEAFGLFGWVLVLKKFKFIPLNIVALAFAVVLVFEVYSFGVSYFKTPSDTVLRQMLYGDLDLSGWLAKNSAGREVLLSRSISEPQIFLAFADKWDPTDFQKSTKTWIPGGTELTWVDQLPSYSLDNYTIKSIDWKKDVLSGDLIVARADEYTGSTIPVETIRYPDGSADIYVIDTNQKAYAKVN